MSYFLKDSTTRCTYGITLLYNKGGRMHRSDAEAGVMLLFQKNNMGSVPGIANWLGPRILDSFFTADSCCFETPYQWILLWKRIVLPHIHADTAPRLMDRSRPRP